MLQAHLLQLRLVQVEARTDCLCLEHAWFLHPRGLKVLRVKAKVNLRLLTKGNQKVKADLSLLTKGNLSAKERNVLKVRTNLKAVVSLKVQVRLGVRTIPKGKESPGEILQRARRVRAADL